MGVVCWKGRDATLVGETEEAAMGSNPASPKKRHWLRWSLVTLAVLLALFYLGGGWYFSGRIKAGGLDPKPPERNYDVTIEDIDDDGLPPNSPGGWTAQEHNHIGDFIWLQ